MIKLEASKPARIRTDYRSRFISLLKRVFGAEEFEKNKVRPYTFAVYFGKAKVGKEWIEDVRFINLRISTGDPEYGIRLYNGFLNLKGNVHRIGDNAFFIKDIILEKEGDWSRGLFKTLSPAVVERHGVKDRDPGKKYAVPSDEDFREHLLENTLRRFQVVMGYEPQLNGFELEPEFYKVEFVRHYGGYVRTFMGRFRIKTDSPELLRFVYEYGLGLRTGQGFGYLEVI